MPKLIFQKPPTLKQVTSVLRFMLTQDVLTENYKLVIFHRDFQTEKFNYYEGKRGGIFRGSYEKVTEEGAAFLLSLDSQTGYEIFLNVPRDDELEHLTKQIEDNLK